MAWPAAAADDTNEPDSGIIRVPAEAISRPLADAASGLDGLLGRDGFVTEQRLADLLFRGRAKRVGRGVVACDGQRYRIEEAVAVHRAIDDDPYGLCGNIETMTELQRAGAQVQGRTMTLGRAKYAVERGVLVRAEAPAARGYDAFDLLRRIG